MVRRNANVSNSRFEHASYAVEYAAGRCNLLALIVGLGWDRVKVTEQFVSAIHEVDIQARTTLTSTKEAVSLDFRKFRCNGISPISSPSESPSIEASLSY